MLSLWYGSAQTGSELPDTQIVSLLSLGTARKMCAVNFCKVSFQLNSLFSVIKTVMTAWLTLIWFIWFDWYLALDILVFDRNLNLIIFFHRYLALEGLCLMSNSEFSADAVRKHQETVVSALKVNWPWFERTVKFLIQNWTTESRCDVGCLRTSMSFCPWQQSRCWQLP